MTIIKIIESVKNVYNNIHIFLAKPKFRVLILFPPLFLCIIGVLVAFYQVHSNFDFVITSSFQYIFIGSAIWLLLSLWLILWSDYKRIQNNNE